MVENCSVLILLFEPKLCIPRNIKFSKCGEGGPGAVAFLVEFCLVLRPQGVWFLSRLSIIGIRAVYVSSIVRT